MPQPSTYTEELAAEIVRRLSTGEPLAVICRDAHMPAVRTVSDWKRDHPEFGVAFGEAREDGADAIAADCLRIADTPMVGLVEKVERLAKPREKDGPEDAPTEYELVVTETRREDMLGHRKLQVETRLKLLAKWDPRRYGDRTALEHSGSLTLEALIAQSLKQPS
jgi:hypothetical protein